MSKRSALRETTQYSMQEEKLYQILRVWPDASAEACARLIKDLDGVTMTETCYRRARARLHATPVAATTDKAQYVQALAHEYPVLDDRAIIAKLVLFFGEEMRGDLVREHRRVATEQRQWQPGEAKAIIERVEASRAASPQRGFVL